MFGVQCTREAVMNVDISHSPHVSILTHVVNYEAPGVRSIHYFSERFSVAFLIFSKIFMTHKRLSVFGL